MEPPPTLLRPPRPAPPTASARWRRLDTTGHEVCRLTPDPAGAGWTLAGTAAFAHDGAPVWLDYAVAVDAAWRTRAAWVGGHVGDRAVAVVLRVDEDGTWWMNGAPCPALSGCVDVDLNFSPSTNLLPIRRLGLGVGAAGDVRAAWLRFPSFALEPLPQTYTRTGALAYHYASDGGAFTARLAVDAAGFPTRYAVWAPPEG